MFWLILTFVGLGFCFFISTYLVMHVSERVAANIRLDVYRHLQQLSLKFYDNCSTGELTSQVTSDVNLLQEIMRDNFAQFLTQAVSLVGALIALFYLDWRLTLIILAVTPLAVLILLVLGGQVEEISRTTQESLAQAVSVLDETLGNIRLVKAFARQAYEIARFAKKIDQTFQLAMRNARLIALLEALSTVIASATISIALWFGGREVIDGHLAPLGLVAYLGYTTMAAFAITLLAWLYTQLRRALGAAQRLFELLDTTPEITDRPDAINLPVVQGEVVFDAVSFAYTAETPVLSQVSFCAAPGQVVALVGPSGAGKTTLVNLLARFYEVDGGRICIDGHDIRQVSQASLHAQIGIVPQEAVLFAGTVAENIRYGKLEANDAEVEAAARAANAHEFIVNELTDGYQTLVGERGVKLSGGQRQRIAIARAILKNPRILILDEATSALDSESERLIQDALERLLQGRTSFVIAHRLSTITQADQIIVLADGQVVEHGTHLDLLHNPAGTYHRLYTIQFAAPEVA